MLPGFTAEQSLAGTRNRYRPPALRDTRGTGPVVVTPQSFDLNQCVNSCYSPDQECVDGCYIIMAMEMAMQMQP
jgi:hypothetical protein